MEVGIHAQTDAVFQFQGKAACTSEQMQNFTLVESRRPISHGRRHPLVDVPSVTIFWMPVFSVWWSGVIRKNWITVSNTFHKWKPGSKRSRPGCHTVATWEKRATLA